MNNNRIKTTNGKKPFYYKDIIDYIKNQNKNMPNIKPQTKIIYQNILQQHTKQYKTAGEIQWKNHIANINLEKIWKNTYKSYEQAFMKDLHYRLPHYSTKTNKYKHKCSSDINPQCDYCGHTEDNLHLFIQCARIRNIWKHYQTILTKLTAQSYTPQQHILTLNTSNTNKNTTKLRITIIQIIYETWQSRNYYKYENKLVPQQTIINKINGQLNSILLLHYKKHKVQDRLETFNQQFCINEAIAKLQNKTINFIE